MFGASKFQLGVYAVIIVAVAAAVFVFAFLKKDTKSETTLTMWGPFPKKVFLEALTQFNLDNRDTFELKYQQIDGSYEEKFVNALASGEAPDFLIITQDLILKHGNKMSAIPFVTLSERSFRDTFIDESDLFLTDKGALAIPFIVDPVVLYWNKDLFAKAGLAGPPKFWDEFSVSVQALTEKDRVENIIQSGAAFGEFANVENAKEILSFLFLQTGNPIVGLKDKDLKFAATDSITSALRFYTEFSNPSKVFYSWNRGLPNSKEFFVSGKLAMYFGYAGEIDAIKEKNPHLNFDVTTVPQIKDSSIQATFGKIYALAVPKSSIRAVYAMSAIFKFAINSAILGLLEESFRLPPAARSLLSRGNSDPELSVFYKAAVQSRGWLEPDGSSVSEIFQNMVESISTGKKGIQEAILAASNLLNKELQKVKDK